MKRVALSAFALLVIASPGYSQTLRKVTLAGTSTSIVSPNDDRKVNTMAFDGATNTFGTANFNQWTDGQFKRVQQNGTVQTAGWSTGVTRDVSTAGNLYVGNPDQADSSTPLPNPASISDIFGANSYGNPAETFQNLSYLVDGEDSFNQTFDGGVYYQLDLLFGGGRFVIPDNDSTTVELTVLERGLNSAIRVFGIKEDNSLTPGVLLNFSSGLDTLFTLNTLEIPNAQSVGGIGVSFDNVVGERLIGFRFQYDNLNNMRGPDILGIGASLAVVPEPATLVQAAFGGMGASMIGLVVRRRRRRLAA